MSPEFKDKLTPEQIEQYKQLANKRLEKIENDRLVKEEIEDFVRTNDVMKKIKSGELSKFDDIVEALYLTRASETESKIILEKAGFQVKVLPTKLRKENRIGVKKQDGNIITEVELKRKKSESEQLEYKDKVQNRIFSLLEGQNFIDDKDLENTDNRTLVKDRINEVKELLTIGTLGGYLTEKEYETFIDQLNPKISQLLEATAKGNFNDDGGWKHFSIGYDDLNKEIKKVLELNNLDEDPEDLKGKDKEKYYFIENNVTNSYIKSMEKQFKTMKETDKTGKYTNVNNWIEFQDYIDYDTRKKMYDNALNDALLQYADNDLNINTGLYVNPKTGELTDKDGLMERIEVEKNKKRTIELTYLLNNQWRDVKPSKIIFAKKENKHFCSIINNKY